MKTQKSVKNINNVELDSYELSTTPIMKPLPDWYKSLSLLELQLKALQEDIPRDLRERNIYSKDLETFDMNLTAMRAILHRVIEELTNDVCIMVDK